MKKMNVVNFLVGFFTEQIKKLYIAFCCHQESYRQVDQGVQAANQEGSLRLLPQVTSSLLFSSFL